jgi:hypothetical protein
MYGSRLCNEYMKWLDAFVHCVKKDVLDNVRGNLYCPYKHCKNEKKYHTNDVLMSHLIKHGFVENYQYWNKHGEEGINEEEVRDSYLKMEVPTGVEEDHGDVNETNILGFTDDDIEFHVYNIDEMIHNVKRHDDDDHYSNGELVKYKKMIENSKKSFYHSCAAQYTRLFLMVKLSQLKASNEWSDGSFKELLTLLKDILPQGSTVSKTVYEAKQIICLLGLEVENSTRSRMMAFYIMGPSMKTIRNALFVDSID